uniref:Uncharacterized protein n=1 Tax=Tetranychus urticae TaxID=32264 RepID=T1L615_TETUR
MWHTQHRYEIKTLSEKNLILDNGKTFYNYTERSLNLFLESIYSNDNSELFERYSRIVQILSEGNKLLRIHSTDYLTVNSDTSFSRDELLAMIDAYIDDIEMVQKCEVPLGRPNRVDMKIVELNGSFAKNNGSGFVAIRILVE